MVDEHNNGQHALEIAPQLLDELRQAARPYAEEEGGPHGLDHSERVLHTALFLGRELGADLHVLAAAAILHDIGRSEESASQGTVCHAQRGAELAVPILKRLGYEQQAIVGLNWGVPPVPSIFRKALKIGLGIQKKVRCTSN